MNPYILLIIDMQEAFSLSFSANQVANIQRQIDQAKKDDAQIIAINYSCCGPVVRDLYLSLKGHKKLILLTKHKNNGGGIVDHYIRNVIKSRNPVIKVCGVNSSCCVKDTVLDLLNRKRKVEVLKNCCGDGIYGTNYPFTELASFGAKIK